MNHHYLPSTTVYEPTVTSEALTDGATIRRIVRQRIEARYDGRHPQGDGWSIEDLMQPAHVQPAGNPAATDRYRKATDQALRAERPWTSDGKGRYIGEVHVVTGDGVQWTQLAPNRHSAERVKLPSIEGLSFERGGSYFRWAPKASEHGPMTDGHMGQARYGTKRKGGSHKLTNKERQARYRDRVRQQAAAWNVTQAVARERMAAERKAAKRNSTTTVEWQ